jgi:hypothetical protein
MVEEQLGGGGVLAQDCDTRIGRKMKLSAPYGDRFAQAGTKPGKTALDRRTVRALQNECQ